jgi:uncharacterized protein DUF4190
MTGAPGGGQWGGPPGGGPPPGPGGLPPQGGGMPGGPPGGGFQGGPPQRQGGGQNGLAIGSLVCGILGLLLAICTGFGGLLGIVAIVLGVIGRKQIKESGGGSTAMATAGLVLGILAIVVIILWVVFFLILGSFDWTYYETN